jgi:transposase InsO family protein
MLLFHTIPELRQRVARLGFRLAEIDLRWDLAEEQMADSNLASLCLGELERGQRRQGLVSPSVSTSIASGELIVTASTPPLREKPSSAEPIYAEVSSLTEAQKIVETWRAEYNESRPHRALGEKTPNEFAKEIAASRDFLGIQTAENSP